jgi:protocatechuate 3,4-dioxygenase beta subunit
MLSERRRDFLCKSAALPPALLLLALARPLDCSARALSSTPACTDSHEPTPRQTAGPFFLPHSPQRTSLLEAGITGTKIVLSGRVLSTACQAVSRALLDFWHANDAGELRLRPRTFTPRLRTRFELR